MAGLMPSVGQAVLLPTTALPLLQEKYGNGFLHGVIKGRDPGHKDCVLIKCREDPRTFYFDAAQAATWVVPGGSFDETNDIASGIVGKEVLVPSDALVALVEKHGSGVFLHGIVKGRDPGHKDCVLIKCREDPRTFYFDAEQAKKWLVASEKEDSVASLRGKEVLIPSNALAALVERHGSGVFLHGIVQGKDPGHKDCVLIKCREDPRTFFFDAEQIREWLKQPKSITSPQGLGQQAGKGPTALHHSFAPPPHHSSFALPPLQTGFPPLPSSKRAKLEHTPAAALGMLNSMGAQPSKHPGSSWNAAQQGKHPFLQRTKLRGPPPKGTTKRAEVADLIGKEVDIPGPVFHEHTPGVHFRARVTGPETAHAASVVVHMLDNPRSRYFFRASEVREWMWMMKLRAGESSSDEEETLDEALAAEVLANMPAASPSPAGSSKDAFFSRPAWWNLSGPPASASPPPSEPNKYMLQWGSTELIAQRASILSPALAEQLARISMMQPDDAAAAQTAAALPQLADQPQGGNDVQEQGEQQQQPQPQPQPQQQAEQHQEQQPHCESRGAPADHHVQVQGNQQQQPQDEQPQHKEEQCQSGKADQQGLSEEHVKTVNEKGSACEGDERMQEAAGGDVVLEQLAGSSISVV